MGTRPRVLSPGSVGSDQNAKIKTLSLERPFKGRKHLSIQKIPENRGENLNHGLILQPSSRYKLIIFSMSPDPLLINV